MKDTTGNHPFRKYNCMKTHIEGYPARENLIGENIRALRTGLDMKQDTLASELNIKRQSLSAYERGITLPDIYVLMRIADYFGITLDELTGRGQTRR